MQSDLTRLLRTMRRDWDQRARRNARHYIASAEDAWTEEEFYRTGQATVEHNILQDTGNVCQGRDPKQMRVLEIGCGAGRVTRALAQIFGEVHAVDVSGEMIELARQALADHSNAFVYQNNGIDLTCLPSLPFDFAFSYIVFQHIPSRAVIENYIHDVGRLLRPGCLFKFQVQGIAPGKGRLPTWLMASRQQRDTWHGVHITEADAMGMARRSGFDLRYQTGAGEQYYWLWFFKR